MSIVSQPAPIDPVLVRSRRVATASEADLIEAFGAAGLNLGICPPDTECWDWVAECHRESGGYMSARGGTRLEALRVLATRAGGVAEHLPSGDRSDVVVQALALAHVHGLDAHCALLVALMAKRGTPPGEAVARACYDRWDAAVQVADGEARDLIAAARSFLAETAEPDPEPAPAPDPIADAHRLLSEVAPVFLEPQATGEVAV